MGHASLQHRIRIGPATVVWLGALTGFVLGIVFELFRLNAHWQRVEAWLTEEALLRAQGRNDQPIACFIPAPAFDITIPLLSSVFFAMAAVAVVFWLAQRPRLLLTIWTGCVFLVLGPGYLLAVPKPSNWAIYTVLLLPTIALSGYASFRRYPNSAVTLWLLAGITFLLVPASASLFLKFATLNMNEEQTPSAWLLCMVVTVPVSALFGWVLKHHVNRQTAPLSLNLSLVDNGSAN